MSRNEGKKHNPNRLRSKNNPVGERNDPQIDWIQNNKSRRAEGRRYIEWLPKVVNKAREIMGIPRGKRDWRISAILVAIVKSEENLPYWRLVKHFDKHPEDLKRCELYRPYSESLYHLRIDEIDPKVQQQIITWMAGEDMVPGTKIANSSGFSIAQFIEWQHAKYGKLSVHDFAKLYTPQGKICAAMVTLGKANDSPYL